MTRRSGFSVHPDTTGGEFRRVRVKTYELGRGESVKLTFRIQDHAIGDLLGYGAWFWHTDGIERRLSGGPSKRTLTDYTGTSWNKVGSIWRAQNVAPIAVSLLLTATKRAVVALADPVAGRIKHRHLDGARPVLLSNMFEIAPEAVFTDGTPRIAVSIEAPRSVSHVEQELLQKSCNRCGRYLPINVPIERDQLSFSNHCVAAHRRPCRHATFGRLRNIDAKDDVLTLDYGFQLECRFCKKFEVNAAHNPQRTGAQMKEDAARRRAFELLLAELYGGTPQLRYRREHGSELADDVWKRFARRCFKCGEALPTVKDMNLDHTRPLALLWPLDGTATALCESCNSAKRDRAPGDFYTDKKLAELSLITGISVRELHDAGPNEDALDRLVKRLKWFFETFLSSAEMTKERDGKIVGELVIKALQKVLARSARHSELDVVKEYDRKRKR
jgi:hypothetical protein